MNGEGGDFPGNCLVFMGRGLTSKESNTCFGVESKPGREEKDIRNFVSVVLKPTRLVYCSKAC